MMLHKKIRLFACMVLINYAVAAQQFTVRAGLQPIDSNGFYSIGITPELSSYAATDFRDLRIADDKNQFVPYIILPVKPSFAGHDYNRLDVITNEVTDSGRSVVIVQNKSHKKISSIVLLIRNAAVNRGATISGSDDLKNWFTIIENIRFESQTGTEADRYFQSVNFPTSSYTFFKITINNGRNDPLNIIEAGSYINTAYTPGDNYILNPLPVFKQTDSADGNSYIRVHQYRTYHIEKIKLAIKTPGFYERVVEVINARGISDFKIRSGSTPGLDLPVFNDTAWIIKIYNGDNPPLKIDSVILLQQSQKITAYLQGGKNYHLLLNDAAAIKPVYDLQQFKDSIPLFSPRVNVLSYETIKAGSSREKHKLIISTGWLWTLIIVVLITLGIVTHRLTKEMADKGKVKAPGREN